MLLGARVLMELYINKQSLLFWVEENEWFKNIPFFSSVCIIVTHNTFHTLTNSLLLQGQRRCFLNAFSILRPVLFHVLWSDKGFTTSETTLCLTCTFCNTWRPQHAIYYLSTTQDLSTFLHSLKSQKALAHWSRQLSWVY